MVNFGELWTNIRRGLSKNSSDILTGAGIGSLIGATILGIGATPEAQRRIEKMKIKLGKDKLTVGETIKACGTCYIPTATAIVFGTGCCVASNVTNNNTKAALATACSIAQTSLSEYQAKVIETIGEKKERGVRDAVVKDKIDRNPPPKEMIIGEPTSAWGQVLFYDVLTGRYFHSDMETLRRAANKLNHCMTTGSEIYISLNEWYMEIGLDPIYDIGEEYGWNTQGLIEIRTVEHRRANGTYVTGVDFEVKPAYGYDQF